MCPQIIDVIKVSGGLNYTLLLTKNGDVYSYGVNNYVQLGRPGDSESKSVPAKIESVSNVGAISAGWEYALIMVEKQNLYGDVAGDEIVSINDVIIILRHIVGLSNIGSDYSSNELKRSMVSGEGEISIKDAILLLRYIVGLISKFPLETHSQIL